MHAMHRFSRVEATKLNKLQKMHAKKIVGCNKPIWQFE